VGELYERIFAMDNENIPTTNELNIPRKPGRPLGSRNKSRQLIDALSASDPNALQAIVDTTLAAAKNGRAWAIQILMDRLYPVPRGRLVEFELPPLNSIPDVQAALNAVLQAVAGGALTLEEGESMCSMISDYAKPIIEQADFERRVIEAEPGNGAA
jgi:hypothetical protein